MIVVIIILLILILLILLILLLTKPKESITMYYSIDHGHSDTVVLSNDPEDYGSVKSIEMQNCNGSFNGDIIMFTGYRLHTLYNETIEIKTINGDYVKASNIYNDTAENGFATTGLKKMEYYISVGTCMFYGFKILTIYFEGNKRTVKLS